MTALLIWLSLFILSILAIVIVVGRHRQALVALNIASIPRAQEKIVKKELVTARVFRTIQKNFLTTLQKLGPVYATWMLVQKHFRNFANGIADKYRALEWKQKWQLWRTRSRHERRAHLLTLLDEADALRRAENFDAAEKKYIEILTLDPRNVSAYVGLGKTYFRSEKWDEAVETLHHVVDTLDGAHERAWAFLGRSLKALEKWDEAIVAFERAIALDDTMAKRWIDLGECYAKRGFVDKAQAAFEKAAEIEPHNPWVLDHLIEISIISGDKRCAQAAFSELQSVNPENQKLVEWGEQIGEMR